jgi:GTPase KRas protein
MEFVQLPQEVLLELFQYLSLPELCVLGQTNTALYNLTNDDQFWKSRVLRNLRNTISKEQANKYIDVLEKEMKEKSDKKKRKFQSSDWKKIVDIYSVLSKERRWIPKDHFSEEDVLPHWDAYKGPGEGHSSIIEFRVSVMGKDRVGKSALTVRFVSRQFITEYDPTIEDSYRKTIRMPGAKKDHLIELLDTAGQTEFAALQNISMKAPGFILVYDITSSASFEHIKLLVEKIKEVKQIDDVSTVAIVIVGNKFDYDAERQVSPIGALLLAKELNAPYFETSAKSELNVDNAFFQIMYEIMWKDWKYRQGDKQLVVKKSKDKNCIIS